MLGDDLFAGVGQLFIGQAEFNFAPVIDGQLDVVGIDVIDRSGATGLGGEGSRFADLDRITLVDAFAFGIIATMDAATHSQATFKNDQGFLGIKYRIIRINVVSHLFSVSIAPL